MKLVLLRNQSVGVTGNITFSITAQVEITQKEKDDIVKYKIGKTLLYTNLIDRGKGLLGFLFRKANAVEFTVNDLVKGTKVECKDIIGMLDLEEIIVEASQTLKNILEASATFGGETVIEL